MAPADEEFTQYLTSFLSNVRHGKVRGSYDVALHTALLLRKLVGSSKWATAYELMEALCGVGHQIMKAQPNETSVGNIVRRVLKLVREEHAVTAGKRAEAEPGYSLQNTLMASNEFSSDFTRPSQGLNSAIMDSINELISELEACRDNIAAQAMEHIHSNEVIMTFGKSRTVEKFLKNAARRRKFSVIVAEGAPLYRGQELAKSLAESDIDTTVISDSAIFAIMARVNKVIIGTHAVMADGGLKAANGAHALALAAKHHSVPLFVCAGMFKLSPRYVCSYDQDDINQLLSPDDVMKFSTGDIVSKISVYNPVFDYISPDLVNLYISDQGGNAPSYMYRLLTELYDAEDYDLCMGKAS